jgi:hypothetical protein
MPVPITRQDKTGWTLGCSLALLLSMAAGCARKPEVAVKKMPAGAQFAGFLSSYDKLKPNPQFESTVTYVRQDDVRNVHKYFAVIVEPVEVYVATNADPSKMPDRGRAAVVAYFQNAITKAISDAFPVVQEPGPLVLRLRTALIGVDVGGDAIDIGKVGVEMEMVDSVTGEQIAAAVDRQNLGSGATVGSETIASDERFAAAREAFDGWAARLREFVDSAHELSAEEAGRVDASYRPYGDAPAVRK